MTYRTNWNRKLQKGKGKDLGHIPVKVSTIHNSGHQLSRHLALTYIMWLPHVARESSTKAKCILGIFFSTQDFAGMTLRPARGPRKSIFPMHLASPNGCCKICFGLLLWCTCKTCNGHLSRNQVAMVQIAHIEPEPAWWDGLKSILYYI